MSEADPRGVDGSPAKPAGRLDSPTAAGPWSPPSPSTAAAAASIFTCGDATASWPGVAFPRRRANPVPVGGAAAVIMSPTPPRYLPTAAPTPTDAPAATTTPTDAPAAANPANPMSMQGRLQSLSASSSKLAEGIDKIYGLAKDVTNFTDWTQLPGLFKCMSSVFDGANEVLQGSCEAFGAIGVSSQLFHEVHSYIPSLSYTLPKARRPCGAYAGCSYPQQGINSLLSYQIVKRSSVDSVLVVQDNNGSRRSPKKVLPRVRFIKTIAELKDTVQKFQKGDPVHLIDVSDEDVHPELALDFWNHLLAHGATALLRRDSNLCRMSKMAYALLEERRSLQNELEILNTKVVEMKHSISLLSDMLGTTKPKSAKLTGTSRSIDFTSASGHIPSASMTNLSESDEKKKNDTDLLVSKERVRTLKVTNVSLSATVQDIMEFFSCSGDIEHVEMQSADEWSQVAYVTFKNAQGAESALLLSGATIVDLSVIIAPAPEYQPPPTVSGPPTGATIVDLSVITAPAPEYQPPPTVSGPPMELNQTSTNTNISGAV